MKKLIKYILSEFGGKVVKKEEIEEVCGRFKADVDKTINFMISYGYFVRILRGLYYVKTLEEFKLKKSLFGFGVIEKNGIKFSDLEKTILDIIYISRYRSVPEERIISVVDEYKTKIKKRKIVEYLKFYPKSVREVAKNAGVV